jgi:Ca2+-binding RTX toxin-like protein
VIGGTYGIETTGGDNNINVLSGGSVIGLVGMQIGGTGGNKITIAGEVTGTGSINNGITVDGGSNVVTIASTGRVLAPFEAILFSTTGSPTGANQVINSGWIEANNFGVLCVQTGSFMLNTGTVIGGNGVFFNGAGTAGTKNTLVNSGVIAGGAGNAVRGDTGVDEITNNGTIIDLIGTSAINTLDSDDIVTNNGVVQGNATAAIKLGNGNDTYNGAGGIVNGKVFGEGGDDTLIGGAGVDVFDGGANNDTLSGGGGADVLEGGSGANTMSGGDGNDNLTATGNLNVANGDNGQDSLFFVGDSNQLFGGNDNDFVGANNNANALFGGGGDDFIGATGSGNTLLGGDGNDTVQANGASSMALGEAGNDFVGCSGNSTQLFGGDGDDFVGATGTGNKLDGGTGNDALVAGAHSGDTFVFHAGYGLDSITGFARHGGGGTDVIDLNGFGLNFTTLQPFMADASGNCVITINAATILTINGVTKAQLLASDFVF